MPFVSRMMCAFFFLSLIFFAITFLLNTRSIRFDFELAQQGYTWKVPGYAKTRYSLFDLRPRVNVLCAFAMAMAVLLVLAGLLAWLTDCLQLIRIRNVRMSSTVLCDQHHDGKCMIMTTFFCIYIDRCEMNINSFNRWSFDCITFCQSHSLSLCLSCSFISSFIDSILKWLIFLLTFARMPLTLFLKT